MSSFKKIFLLLFYLYLNFFFHSEIIIFFETEKNYCNFAKNIFDHGKKSCPNNLIIINYKKKKIFN